MIHNTNQGVFEGYVNPAKAALRRSLILFSLLPTAPD